MDKYSLMMLNSYSLVMDDRLVSEYSKTIEFFNMLILWYGNYI